MGNIKNPTLNRWGLNLFWHRFWYSKKNYNRNIQQDTLFITLFKTYIMFSINVGSKAFKSRYYFSSCTTTFKLPQNFHRVQTIDPNTFEKKVVSYRKKYSTFFKARASLMRYSNWLVLVFQWLSPAKSSKPFKAKRTETTFVGSASEKKLKGLHFGRYTLFYQKSLTNHFSGRLLYTF